MAQATILIAEDQIGQRIGFEIQTILRRTGDYTVTLVEGPLLDVMDRVRPSPDLFILVVPQDGKRAEELWARLAMPDPATPVLAVLTAENGAQSLNQPFTWSTDFLMTPLREVEVLARVQRLLSWRKEQDRIAVNASANENAWLAQLVGEAPAFLAVRQRIPLMARCDAPVLITGETGTGKELVARALHHLGCRAGRPFIAVNCGAIPVELFESELFGHEKGAFTSASSVQPGLVAEAEGGTLFLDEIEALSLEAQVKLLRFLEDHTYHALGAPRSRRSDVQIIAATNVKLIEKIRAGAFRDDLFYRLAVLTLSLPPLRERRGDIALLVVHFLKRYASRPGAKAKQLSPCAMEVLSRYAWPGNVRELENVIRQAILLADSPIIEAEDLRIPFPRLLQAPRCGAMKQAKARILEEFEKAYVTELLTANHGNVTRAAREAQKERRAFGRLVKKYHLTKH